MKREEVVARARSAAGHKCAYGLGKGGFNPAAPHPWNSAGLCDCSGFAAWCLGQSRHTDNPWYAETNGGWLETSAIVRDCGTPFGMFDKAKWTEAKPGDLVVYGDEKRADGTARQGHVGVIVEVSEMGPKAAVHCSSGNFRTYQDAIRETSVGLWTLHLSVVARCAILED